MVRSFKQVKRLTIKTASNSYLLFQIPHTSGMFSYYNITVKVFTDGICKKITVNSKNKKL